MNIINIFTYVFNIVNKDYISIGEFSYSTLDFARKSFAGASQILTNFLNNNRGEKGNSAQIIRLRGTKIYVYRDKYGCLRWDTWRAQTSRYLRLETKYGWPNLYGILASNGNGKLRTRKTWNERSFQNIGKTFDVSTSII